MSGLSRFMRTFLLSIAAEFSSGRNFFPPSEDTRKTAQNLAKISTSLLLIAFVSSRGLTKFDEILRKMQSSLMRSAGSTTASSAPLAQAAYEEYVEDAFFAAMYRGFAGALKTATHFEGLQALLASASIGAATSALTMRRQVNRTLISLHTPPEVLKKIRWHDAFRLSPSSAALRIIESQIFAFAALGLSETLKTSFQNIAPQELKDNSSLKGIADFLGMATAGAAAGAATSGLNTLIKALTAAVKIMQDASGSLSFQRESLRTVLEKIAQTKGLLSLYKGAHVHAGRAATAFALISGITFCVESLYERLFSASSPSLAHALETKKFPGATTALTPQPVAKPAPLETPDETSRPSAQTGKAHTAEKPTALARRLAPEKSPSLFQVNAPKVNTPPAPLAQLAALDVNAQEVEKTPLHTPVSTFFSPIQSPGSPLALSLESPGGISPGTPAVNRPGVRPSPPTPNMARQLGVQTNETVTIPAETLALPLPDHLVRMLTP